MSLAAALWDELIHGEAPSGGCEGIAHDHPLLRAGHDQAKSATFSRISTSMFSRERRGDAVINVPFQDTLRSQPVFAEYTAAVLQCLLSVM